ncbi:hypothetical protein C8J56DRAFT_1039510 [Mycena floridula]|nr:hypothetical protein C8J56DRAFT_1039510 [Mycena floridula]
MSDQHQGSFGYVQEPTTLSSTETVLDVQQPTTPPVSVISQKPHPIRQPDTVDPRLLGSTIPPEHSQRTLILCFDGTGDQFDNDNSNIISFFSALKKNDRTKQMVYYQAGIGTYISPQIATPLYAKLSKTLDTMIACHLDAHVMDGYEFLMQNYVAGDRICLFGFSRGALAGMIHKVGLLPADNLQQVPFAYKMYTRADAHGWDQSNAFKKAFSVDVKIEFVGVWDTVNSVGLIPKRLPFTTSNTIVRTFRHALSLDERRAKFKANLWNRPQDDEASLGLPSAPSTPQSPVYSLPHMPTTASSLDSRPTAEPSIAYNYYRYLKKLSERSPEDERILSELEKKYSTRLSRHSDKRKKTDVLEVWFPGCHCDVGGGSVSNSTPYSLARISLRWMIRECFKTDTGIMFDTGKLQELGMDPSTLYPFVTPRPPPLSPPLSAAQAPLVKRPSALQPRNPFKALAKRIVEKSRPRDSISSPLVEKFKESEEKPLPHTPLTEEEEELRDALSPIYDQLKIKKSWWVLEILPMEYKYQENDDKWKSWFGPNLACPRRIPRQDGIKFHRSVKTRMEADAKLMHNRKPYIPKAFYDTDPVWVD